MKTLDKCRELLEPREGVEQVEVIRDEFLHARFASRLNPKEPHDLVVHPVTEKQVLKVVVPHLAKAKVNGELLRVLSHLNYDTLLGKVGVDQDGWVRRGRDLRWRTQRDEAAASVWYPPRAEPSGLTYRIGHRATQRTAPSVSSRSLVPEANAL